MLPDIINFTQKTLAEIKSANPAEIALGAAKLAVFLTIANSATMAGSTSWHPDLWFPTPPHVAFWLGAVDPMFPDWYGVIMSNLLGVITYQLFQVRPGDPVPVTVPVPLPELELETVKALEALERSLTYEDMLISDYLGTASTVVLGGTALTLGGMVVVDTVNSLQGLPSLYRGITQRFSQPAFHFAFALG